MTMNEKLAAIENAAAKGKALIDGKKVVGIVIWQDGDRFVATKLYRSDAGISEVGLCQARTLEECQAAVGPTLAEWGKHQVKVEWV